MESIEEILSKTKEHAKKVILTATSICLIGVIGTGALYYKKALELKKENEREEYYQETLLNSLSSISDEFENLKDSYRYLMYKMYQQKDDISIVPYEILCPVLDTFPDIVVSVPHKKGTGLLYLFVMDERRKQDARLHDCQDDEHKTKMIRLIDIDESLEDSLRRSFLYNSIDYIIFEAKRFYNEN
ncbi:MAG: hypothetical protein ACP5OZ_01190 [Candidatus Woesearchaeota archaeon]